MVFVNKLPCKLPSKPIKNFNIAQLYPYWICWIKNVHDENEGS